MTQVEKQCPLCYIQRHLPVSLLTILVWLVIACSTANASGVPTTLPNSLPASTPSQPAPPTRWSQLADTVFQHFTADDGLPHSIVTALATDGHGFLWVGTQGGLARWDGYRFRNYLNNPKDANSLPDNSIQTMHTDRLGRLWIGTSGGGLARYDFERDSFVNISASPTGLSHVSIMAIADDGVGGIWLGTNGGLDHFNPDTGAISHLRQDDKIIGSLPDNHIRSLLLDRNGSLWVGTRKGLVRRDRGLNSTTNFTEIKLPLASNLQPNVFSLFQASDGRIWIGTVDHGAYVFDPATGTALALKETGHASSPSTSQWAYTIAEARPGEIWLGIYSQYIIAVDSATMQTRRIRHDPTLPTSLAGNTVWALLKDSAGLIWTGTERGLSRHDPGQNAIATMFSNSMQRDRLSADVLSFLTTTNGEVWLGLDNSGVDIVDPIGHKVTELLRNTKNPDDALSKANVSALTASPDGTLYLGTNSGLYSSDQSGYKIRRLALSPRAPSEAIRALLCNDDILWIGGDADGLWKFDVNSGTSVERPKGADQLTDQRISIIEQGPGGALWIGTLNGLNLFNPISHTVEQILPNPSDPKALAASYITSLLTDHQGRLWVGTQNGGINILVARDAKGLPQFHRLSTTHGLPNANINKLLQDTAGNIWASTDDGLVVINPKTFAVRALQRPDGVAIPIYWTNSGIRTAKNELLFGGLGGLTIVRPDLIKEWHFRPLVVVTDVRVGGKSIVVNRFNNPALNPKHEPLVITPDANSLAVEFSALDYSAPERNRYAYRLEGYDNDWVETDHTRRLAAYTNLPPGNYHLRLRGSNRNGLWSEKELVLPIRVLPAWHHAWWFMLIEALAAVAAIYALVQARTKYLRLRQRELESQVAQRTAQLREKQVELVDANHELFDTNKALNNANTELALSAETLRQLGDVGRDITANLKAEMVFEALHRHVGGLLDAPTMAIHRTNATGNMLIACFGRQDGQSLSSPDIALDSPTSHTARTARQQLEVLLEKTPGEADPSHVSGTRIMLTSLFAPLIVDQRVLGVMSIQSDQEHAYGERERLIFRTLCAYGAIALANAEALSALHEAQAQLVQQEKLASLGGLVAGVAHEINTPLGTALTAISGAANSWQRLRQAITSGNLNKSILDSATDEGVEYTDLALRTASRAATLINNFNAIAVRFDSDRTDDLDLAKYLSAIAALVNKGFEQRGHQLEIEVAEDLTVHIVQDALTEALTRVLANILDHAFDDHSSGIARITALRNGDGDVEIVVSDNGRGIAPEDLPKVFNPFFSTQSGSQGHAGLGLHVAYNHVTQRLKGQISISSSIGRGTIVTILIFSTNN